MNLKRFWNNFFYYSSIVLIVPIFFINKQKKVMFETFAVFKKFQTTLIKLTNLQVSKLKLTLKDKSIKIPEEANNLIQTIIKSEINIQTINLLNEEIKVVIRLILLKNKQFYKNSIYDQLLDLSNETDSLTIAYYTLYNSLSYKMKKWPYLSLATKYHLKSFRIKSNEY